MLLTGWNMKDALVVAREEGTEDGIEIGMEKVFALLDEGFSLQEAKEKLNLAHHP
jgi:hypothetical protein